MRRYKGFEFINSGTYARVYRATDTKTGNLVAIKRTKISKEEGFPSTTLREICILRKISHPNIINLLDVLATDEDILLVFELVEYDLHTYIYNFDANIMKLIKQLLIGIKYLHSKKIIHRDLKPQNILVSKSGHLKIIDFGLARSLDIEMDSYSNEVVTLWYRSPELLNGLKTYSYYVDMWSIGCVLYEMVTGEILFKADDEKQLTKLLNNKDDKQISFLLLKCGANEFLISGILRCLDINVDKRIEINDLYKEIIR